MSLKLPNLSQILSTTKLSAKLLCIMLCAFLVTESHATNISTNPIAIFNDFSTASERNTSAYHIYAGNVNFLSDTLSAVFYPQRLGGAGLLLLNNINHVNFANSGGTAVHLANPTNNTETFSFELHDNADRAVGIQVTLLPNSANDYVLLNQPAGNGSSFGMEFMPTPYSGLINIACHGNPAFDWNSVYSVQIYAVGPFTTNEVVNVSDIRLLQSYSQIQLMTFDCDQFGQTTLSTAENYVGSAGVLNFRLLNEQNLLASGPLLPHLDLYGGTLSLASQTSTGRFRLQKINGKWWLITPDGNLFFASGVDQIVPEIGQTVVTNRQYMFENLPATNGPLGDNYGTINVNGKNESTYNFYTSNLQQKFGTTAWSAPWFQMVLARLSNWGFNSFGSYSGEYSYGNGQMPYLASLSERGTYDTVNTGNTLWGPIPDPYDPRFQSTLVSNINSDDQAIKNDPFCYGIFTGIEMSWTGASGPLQAYGVAVGTLKASSSSPAKAVFESSLESEYGNNIATLNSHWATNYSSWQAFMNGTGLPATYTSSFLNDLSNFTYTYLRQYFVTVHAVIHQFDPNLLDMGTEVSTNHYSPILMAAASGVVNAMCMNNVEATPDPVVLADASRYDVPVLVSEFHFESPASGMFGGTSVLEPTEYLRDSATATYVNSAEDNPMVIGVNWYRWIDDPLLGDIYGLTGGDNENLGLIDITDTPYWPLIKTFQQVHLTMYSSRWNS